MKGEVFVTPCKDNMEIDPRDVMDERPCAT